MLFVCLLVTFLLFFCYNEQESTIKNSPSKEMYYMTQDVQTPVLLIPCPTLGCQRVLVGGGADAAAEIAPPRANGSRDGCRTSAEALQLRGPVFWRHVRRHVSLKTS